MPSPKITPYSQMVKMRFWNPWKCTISGKTNSKLLSKTKKRIRRYEEVLLTGERFFGTKKRWNYLKIHVMTNDLFFLNTAVNIMWNICLMFWCIIVVNSCMIIFQLLVRNFTRQNHVIFLNFCLFSPAKSEKSWWKIRDENYTYRLLVISGVLDILNCVKS